MTQEEFFKISSTIRVAYPNSNGLNTTEAMDVWYEMLKDLDYKVTAQAIAKWISTEKFSPTIAEIRKCATEVAVGELPDWGQGWLEVKNAISRYGYMNRTEALASMSEITRETVKRMGWLQICQSDIANEPTDRANFRMIYEELVRRKQNDSQTPGYLKELISKTQESMAQALSGDDLLGRKMLYAD